MPVLYKKISDTLADRQLQVPLLSALNPDALLYEILAIQPGGAVCVQSVAGHATFVGHCDRDQAIPKFRAFLDIALQLNSDLALSPEYSFPWEVLLEAIAQGRVPSAGKLWIFGCEAITPELLRNAIAAHPQVEWISEEIPDGPGFLNVLAYFALTNSTNGIARTIVVLQFKHQPMGGDTFERDNLIPGSLVHLWHNSLDNVRLISLICSDALVFSPFATAQCRFDLHPYLVFHPQLNPSPRHVDFATYRGGLFGHNNSERFEVVALNWARRFVLPGGNPSSCGCSAIFTKSEKFQYSDERIEHNHQSGLHFAYWAARRSQIYLLNFDEHVFHYRSPKVRQDVPAALAARTGPEMLSLRSWDHATLTWIASESNDGFDVLGAECSPEGNYCTAAPYTVVDRERLFMLSSGSISISINGQKWHHPSNLRSLQAELDERSKRLTFTHEVSPESIQYRYEHLGRFIELQKTILADTTNYPESIEDLIEDVRMVPPHASTDYRFNLKSISGEKAEATAVFLGTVPPDEATRAFDEIVDLWGGKDRARRLVVWYRVPGVGLRAKLLPPPTIDEDSEGTTSIAKGSAQ